MDKETIRNKAFDMFSQHGYNNVTINDICQELDITKPTFYNYVNSKDELILDLYDKTIGNILCDTFKFVDADNHLEQLYFVFFTLISDTKHFGHDLFSQMLIANLNENHQSFDMRENLTKLCIRIIEKAQNNHEINNPRNPEVLYHSIAYMFTGYEVGWCISNGETSWQEEFFNSLNAVLQVNEKYKDVYKKFLR